MLRTFVAITHAKYLIHVRLLLNDSIDQVRFQSWLRARWTQFLFGALLSEDVIEVGVRSKKV